MLLHLNEQHKSQTAFSLSPFLLVLISSVFITLTGNLTFFSQVTEVYPLNGHAGFIAALFIIIFALNNVLILLFWIVLPLKWAINLLLIITVFCAYFSDKFGVVIDIDMIRNSLQTNLAEASDLLTISLLWRLLFLAIFPIALLTWLRLKPRQAKPSFWSKCKTPALLVGGSLLLIVAGVAFDSAQFSSFIRQHKALRYYINPVQALFSGGKYVALELKSTKNQQFTLLADYAEIPPEDPNRELIIMVVGETARADHFSLNGYNRETNPLLAKEANLLSYAQISSCGTSTAISVPCMFSMLPRDSFVVDNAKETENAFDIIAKADVSVLWRDNNSDSKGVAVRQRFEDFRSAENNRQCDDGECRDVGMLDGLQDFIDQQGHDILIVLHQMGSHGPAYYKRYPAEFARFTPACQTAELSQCSDQEIVNAYDNSILYTDYFLSQVIALLKNNTQKFQTSMLYVSDHGESLGENGVYLHGLPYAFAPETQTHVPVVLWTDEGSDIDLNATRQQSLVANSHDAVAKTLMSLFEIKSDVSFANTPDLLKFKATK